MIYMLDTNIIIYAMKNKYPSILNHFKVIPSSAIRIPSVVVAELEYGARKSLNYSNNILKYRRFISCFKITPFDDAATKHYGNIRKTLEAKGTIIGSNDLLIASIALSHNAVLVTNNTSEFSRVPELFIEDWTN